MSMAEIDLYSDFQIPMEHDLVYLQQALVNHICVHQKIARTAAQLNIPDFRAKKSLHQMEEEIVSIGAEQNVILNQLRLHIDYYVISNGIDRQKFTDHVSERMANYAEFCGPNIRPVNVKRRLNLGELDRKYITNNSIAETNAKKQAAIDEDVVLGDDDDANDINMKSEVMKVFVARQNIPAKSVSQANNQPKQESLLKPKADRIPQKKEVTQSTTTTTTSTAVSKMDQKPAPAPEALNLGRLKLIQALCKAKGEQKPPAEVRTKSPSPDSPRFIPTESKPITILSSSPASSSSEDAFEAIDWTNENATSTESNKETFLHYFGLHTHAHAANIQNKRSVRRRRVCTSTAHRDYHLSRLALFEKQYTNRRNKRPFLYSPPATRAKKQRQIVNDAETQHSNVVTVTASTSTSGNVIKSSTSSSSQSSASSASNIRPTTTAPVAGARVCVTCFKRNNLLECSICMGKYHAACHVGLASSSSLFDICPSCWRIQERRQVTIGSRRKTAYQQANGGKRHIIGH